jgi:hypothetical protein
MCDSSWCRRCHLKNPHPTNAGETHGICALAQGALQGNFSTPINKVYDWRQPGMIDYFVHGARFPTEIYARGCHWIPRMFA